MSICLFCNSKKKIDYISEYNSSTLTFKNLKIYYCEDCFLFFTSPLPSKHELTEYYNSVEETSIGGPNAGFLNNSFAKAIAKVRLKYIKQNTIFNNKKLSILEIGSGFGHLASSLICNFDVEKYCAIEEDKDCHEVLKKNNIQIIKYDELNDKREYDLIVLSHILEHVDNPLNFLKKLKLNLKSSGFVFIDVPCEDWRFKDFVDPHLYFFNKKSIEKMIIKIGFKIRSIGYFGDEINNIFDNKKQYLKMFLVFFYTLIIYSRNILLNSYNKTFNIFELFYKIKFKMDEIKNKKSRWIRVLISF